MLQVGEEHPDKPWMLRAAIGPPRDGVRSLDIVADNVSTQNILLALRMNDMSYTADVPISGRMRGEIGRDGFPTFLSGKVIADAGEILDRKVPEYPMRIDRAEFNVEWDANRRTMVAPFQVVSGPNSITLLAHLEPPNDQVPNWQFGLSAGGARGMIVLKGENEAPVHLQPRRGPCALRYRRQEDRAGARPMSATAKPASPAPAASTTAAPSRGLRSASPARRCRCPPSSASGRSPWRRRCGNGC